MELIKTTKLNKYYSQGEVKNHILKDINISISENDFFGIVGPSGSGKTTLIYCLSTLEKIDSGQVMYLGNDISRFSDQEISDLRKNEISFIFQFYNLIPNLTVYENILLSRVIADKDESNIEAVLEAVDMEDYWNYYPNQLSGGMQQRVAIARALVNNPKVIFADEPTGNLDQKSGKKIMELLKRLNQDKKITIVLVTHNEDYLVYCNKVANLIDGRIK